MSDNDNSSLVLKSLKERRAEFDELLKTATGLK